MSTPSLVLDSHSVGDPARHLTLDQLTGALDALPPAPCDRGRVALIVRRVEGGVREVVTRATFTPEDGLPGDAWGRGRRRSPDAQLAVIQIDVATLVANGQPLPLFGDNLFLDLDLSTGNLPAGTRLRAGSAVLEVSPLPHNGCQKLKARFGDGALRVVSMKERRHRNLRGIYLRVVEAGEIATGDVVEVERRTEAR